MPETGTPIKPTDQPFQTHPNMRTEALAKCYERKYHLADPNQPQPWICQDCGEPSDSEHRMPWRDPKYAVPPKVMHTNVPDELTHNPNASYEERMAERAKTPEERKATAGKPVPAPAPAPHVTREHVIALCNFYNIPLLDPEGASGVSQHVSEKLKQAQDNAAAMETRAKAAEYAAGMQTAPAESAPAEGKCYWCGKDSQTKICPVCAKGAGGTI